MGGEGFRLQPYKCAIYNSPIFTKGPVVVGYGNEFQEITDSNYYGHEYETKTYDCEFLNPLI